jgi:AbrB family looped-hinge helix DNA binding protein
MFEDLKGTGIIRRVDDLGRVVIPKEVRRVMGFSDDQPLEIFTDPGNGYVIHRMYEATSSITQLIGHLSRLIGQDEYLNTKDALLNKVSEIEAILKGEQNEGKE